MDARFLGILSLIVLHYLIFFVQGQITNDDQFSVSLNTPKCLSVIANDQLGVNVVWSGNGSTGWTYRNQPPAFFAAGNTVVMEAENYHSTSAGSLSNISSTWVTVTNTSAGGFIAMMSSPNVGIDTGDSYWGPKMVYNVYFLTNGTYTVWIRGKASQTVNDDSVHVLFETPGYALYWITGGTSRFSGYNASNYQWRNASQYLNVYEATWPPRMWQIWVAQREDGFIADQVMVTLSTTQAYASYTTPISESLEIACTSNQILYVPKQGFSGADTFYYQAQNANGIGTSSVKVYINTPFPTPSVTPSPSRTPSVTPSPSRTPSSSPSSSPSPLPTPVCDGVVSASGQTIFVMSSPPSNFGQTFQPLAPGLLTEFSFYRSTGDYLQANATLTIIEGISTDSHTGVSLGSFNSTFYSAGIQTFFFYPRIRLEAQRYTFLLDGASSSINMVISESVLVGQYCIQNQQIQTVTAAFEYCIITDYLPSPTPTPIPSPSPSLTPLPSTSPASNEDKTKKAFTSAVVLAAIGGGGVLVLSAVIAFFVVRSKRKKSSAERKIHFPFPNIEMAEKPTHPSNGRLPSSAPPFVSSTSRPTSYQGQNWNIPYSELSLEEEIGRGAFGVVYKGTWQGVKVAVKQSLLDESLISELRIQDFFAEAELMKKLRAHPNVTQLLGTCFHPLCIVIEYVNNGSLWTWLEHKPMQEAMQLSIARGIAAGMLYLHREGIIHRDLAARNILLDSNMSPKVSDFGLSRISLENRTNKTASDIGPIRWMAPEAMRQRVYNKKTDMWSYAAVLYEIMTRTMPFHQYDLVHVATSVSLKELSLLPEIHENASSYPAVLVRIMTKCMDFDPDQRPLFENVVQMFDEQNSNQSVNRSQSGPSQQTEYQSAQSHTEYQSGQPQTEHHSGQSQTEYQSARYGKISTEDN